MILPVDRCSARNKFRKGARRVGDKHCCVMAVIALVPAWNRPKEKAGGNAHCGNRPSCAELQQQPEAGGQQQGERPEQQARKVPQCGCRRGSQPKAYPLDGVVAVLQ